MRIVPCYVADMKVWLRASGLRGAALVIAAALTARCGDVNAALGQITESQRLAADLRVAFTKAADASNRAVMADTDELSVADAHAAETAKHAVHTDIDALTPLLKHLGYAEESGLLQDVTTKF